METHTMISVQLSSTVNKQLISTEVQLLIITILSPGPDPQHKLGQQIVTQSPIKIVLIQVRQITTYSGLEICEVKIF